MEALSQFYRRPQHSRYKLMQEKLGGLRGKLPWTILWRNSPGLAEIAKTTKPLFKSPLTFRFEFHDYTFNQSPEIFYVVWT